MLFSSFTQTMTHHNRWIVSFMSTQYSISKIATTNLPSVHGDLTVVAYRNQETGHEPVAIHNIAVESEIPVVVRVHDACFTSEVLGSKKCDCKQQLDYAISYIQEHGGILIYMHQEGRGIGLANKIAAYSLQEQGMDTVEANRALHLPDDARSYNDAIAILQSLNINKISLMTNNPRKISMFQDAGIEIDNRIPIEVPSSSESEQYLQTKKHKMGHILKL